MQKPYNFSYVSSPPAVDQQHFRTERFAQSTGNSLCDARPLTCSAYDTKTDNKIGIVTLRYRPTGILLSDFLQDVQNGFTDVRHPDARLPDIKLFS